MTLLTVVEGIVNNCRITRLSNNPRDLTPLTPNHLLMLRQGPSLPPGKFVEQDRYKRRWKRVRTLPTYSGSAGLQNIFLASKKVKSG